MKNNWFIVRDYTQDTHYRKENASQYNSNGKAVVLNLGGNGCIDCAKISRFIATGERLLGLKPEESLELFDDVDLIGGAYTTKPNQPTIGEFTDEQREVLENSIFMRKCVDESGNKLDTKDLIKAFSTITIFSHCWGAVEASKMGKNIERKMKNMGYSQEDIDSAFNQVVHITYAPYTDHTCFPCLRINSFIDSEHREMRKIYEEAYRQKLNGISIHYDEAGFFRNKKNSLNKVPIVSIYSSQLINTKENSNLQNIIDEHPAETIERNYDWTAGRQQRNGINADIVSQMISYTFALSVAVAMNNTSGNKLKRKPTMLEIYDELNLFPKKVNQEDLETELS